MGVSGGWSEEAAMETSAILTMSASPSPPSSSAACGCKGNTSRGPVNTQCKQELESLMFEGGSDVFTRLMLRSNIQWAKHAAALTLAGVSVFGGIRYLKGRKNSAAASLSS